MRVARSGLAVGTTVLVAACSLLTNVDGLTGSDASVLPDAASADASANDDGAIDGASAESDAGPADATSASDGSATADGSGPCGTRLVIAPVFASAVDPTDGGTLAPTCNVQNLLTRDDAGAGLDQVFPNEVQGSLAGQNVSACVGARFDQDLAEAVVYAKSLAGACTGYACSTGAPPWPGTACSSEAISRACPSSISSRSVTLDTRVTERPQPVRDGSSFAAVSPRSSRTSTSTRSSAASIPDRVR